MSIDSSQTETDLFPGGENVRVQVDGGYTWGLGVHGDYSESQTGTCLSAGFDRDGDVHVRFDTGRICFVNRKFVHPIEEDKEPTMPITETTPFTGGENVRVRVDENYTWGRDSIPGSPPGPQTGTCLSAAPDSDGDVFVKFDTDPPATAYVHHRFVHRIDETQPTPEERKAALRQFIADEDKKWEALEEALHEMADSHDWCGEFEEAIEPLGFAPRPRREREFVVEVRAQFDRSIASPSGDFDRAISEVEGYKEGAELSMSQLSYVATAYVTFNVTGTSPEDVENLVDTDTVSDAIRDQHGVWVDSVGNYEVLSVEEN